MSEYKKRKIKEELLRLIDHEMENEHFPGALLLYCEKGEDVFFGSYGMADKEAGRPMGRDALFRLYSMSKPITAVAAMILWERGQLNLEASVSEYLPEYEQLFVIHSEKPYRITIRQLLNMTAGITYPDEDEAGLDMSRLFEDIHKHIKQGEPYNTREIARRIAGKPLASIPGTTWRYGLCADVLGAVMEEITGIKLGEFYEKEIFRPLGMNDTGFYAPKEKWNRLTQLYRQQPKGDGVRLIVEEERTLGLTKCLEPPTFESAGAGLLSTIDDSAKFCMMLANKGSLNGKRILREETVEQFMKNQLTNEQTKSIYFEHMKGYGYGNLMRVLEDEELSIIGGRKGEFGWDGWAGAYMAVDVDRQSVFLFMVQVCAYSNWPLNKAIRNLLTL